MRHDISRNGGGRHFPSPVTRVGHACNWLCLQLLAEYYELLCFHSCEHCWSWRSQGSHFQIEALVRESRGQSRRRGAKTVKADQHDQAINAESSSAYS